MCRLRVSLDGLELLWNDYILKFSIAATLTDRPSARPSLPDVVGSMKCGPTDYVEGPLGVDFVQGHDSA